MKLLKKIIHWALALMNIAVVAAMLLCVYSQYLHPQSYPDFSYLGMLLPPFAVAVIVFIPVWLVLRWKYAAISIVGLVLASASLRDYCPFHPFGSEPEGRNLKVLSYNVYMFGKYTADTPSFPIVDFILQTDADIVCLQETGNIKRDTIYNQLAAQYPNISLFPNDGSQSALLSKFPILSTDSLSFEGESGTCCFYDVLVGADTVRVYNVHLESYKLTTDEKETYKQLVKSSALMRTDSLALDTLDREQSFWMLEGKLVDANVRRAVQTDRLAEAIERCNRKYIILCGDFNDSPVSYTHYRLTQQLVDAYTESGNGPGWSYNRDGMYFRIDHILASEKFNAYGAKVDKSVQESDHYPIFCTLEMH